MKSILVIFNVTDAGLDDFVAANPVVHCLQPALICAVHEIDDLALVGREVARDRKRSPNISFIEFIAENRDPSALFLPPAASGSGGDNRRTSGRRSCSTPDLT